MFRSCSSLRFTLISRAKAPTGFQPRRNVSNVRAELLQASTPLAEKLSATKLWHWGRRNKKEKAEIPKGDKARVNIVDEKLCGMQITSPYPVHNS